MHIASFLIFSSKTIILYFQWIIFMHYNILKEHLLTMVIVSNNSQQVIICQCVRWFSFQHLFYCFPIYKNIARYNITVFIHFWIFIHNMSALIFKHGSIGLHPSPVSTGKCGKNLERTQLLQLSQQFKFHLLPIS